MHSTAFLNIGARVSERECSMRRSVVRTVSPYDDDDYIHLKSYFAITNI